MGATPCFALLPQVGVQTAGAPATAVPPVPEFGPRAIPREQVHHSRKFQLTFEDFGIISHLVACL